jgi:hypothetical protein
MASISDRLAVFFRRLERRLGVDREGRTVWVWLLPPGVGVVSAALVAFMPGLPTDIGLVYRLLFSLFALVTMTAIAAIYLITFDNDHNQQAAVDDEPGRGDDGPGSPPIPPGSPSPQWLNALDEVSDEAPERTGHASESVPRKRVPVKAGR